MKLATFFVHATAGMMMVWSERQRGIITMKKEKRPTGR
jgi:hypothetical protein